MTILFDIDIIAAVERGDINITDFDPSPDGPLGANSYDVRIDGQYLLEVVWADDDPWFLRLPPVELGGRIDIPVGGTLLVRTLERVGMRGKITGIMKARSSVGKIGIAVCKCAGLGDVGFDNRWTMELSAFTRYGQPWITAGDRIAQIAFFAGKIPPATPYSGQYRIKDWPECMIPKKLRNRIIHNIADIPDYQTEYKGGKIA